MSFIDPNGFSSYSAYSSMMPPPGPQPGVQQQNYGYGGYPPPAYGGYGGGYPPPSFNYGMPPYCPPPPPPPQGGDMGGDGGGFTALIGQFMQLFITAFMGGGMGLGMGGDPGIEEPLPEEEDPHAGGTPGAHGGTPGDQPPGDPQLEQIQGEDASTNTGALNILSAFASELPAKNGKVSLKELKKFVKSPPTDAPEEVVTAAQTLIDNPELYNLLCLKSGGDPTKGFKTSVLDTDWTKTKIDIDNLESADDLGSAGKSLNKVYKELALLSGTEADGITVDDLKDVALGKTGKSKLKDPTIQAAALAILSDPDAVAELDGNDDEIFIQADFTRFIADNK